ncbi:MAG: hypothetical protein KUG77_18070 [Nannocystaceae bacterium]|nr:hypothetical protein [Nannocystaceae bacterium]
MYGTSWALESSTGFTSGPPDCEPQEECGDEGSCPPQTQCSPYVEAKSGELATGCFTTGDRQWGEDCEAACGEVSSRCEEGLVCAVWRDDPACATRCSANGICGPGESCHAPEDLEPANGGCEPLEPCNLLKQNCPDGQDCVVQGGEAVCQPDFGDSTVGDYCEGSEVCASGLLCTSSKSCPEKGMCCMPLCDLNLGAAFCTCLDLELPGQPSAGVCTTLPEP